MGLLPLSLLDLLLTYTFFSNLNPKVITSCCGALFSSGADTLAAEVAGMTPAPAMRVFFSALVLYALALLAVLFRPRPWLRHASAFLAAGFFVAGLLALVSFLSLYIYQLPTHHCPFDMLQGGYHYIGYPLYAGLFGTTLCGLVPGLLQLSSHVPGMPSPDRPVIRRWALAALLFLCLFTLIAAWAMLFSPLKLL